MGACVDGCKTNVKVNADISVPSSNLKTTIFEHDSKSTSIIDTGRRSSLKRSLSKHSGPILSQLILRRKSRELLHNEINQVI